MKTETKVSNNKDEGAITVKSQTFPALSHMVAMFGWIKDGDNSRKIDYRDGNEDDNEGGDKDDNVCNEGEGAIDRRGHSSAVG